MEKALTQLWQRYPQLNTRHNCNPGNRGNAIVAETVTSITGAQSRDSRNQVLRATIKSRQRYENEKIVRQEILSEHSQLSAGASHS